MSTLKATNKMSGRKKIAIVAMVLISAILAGWLTSGYFFSSQEKPLIEDSGRSKQDFSAIPSAEIRVPVTIFYPGDAGLTKEERTIAAGSLPVKMAETVLQEYFKGFKSDLKNTVVRGVYEDRNKMLYVDLSDEFRRYFSGDARYEYYLLKSIYQTVVTNVPEVRDVKILLEGREIESIGGHMLTLTPLKDSVWY